MKLMQIIWILNCSYIVSIRSSTQLKSEKEANTLSTHANNLLSWKVQLFRCRYYQFYNKFVCVQCLQYDLGLVINCFCMFLCSVCVYCVFSCNRWILYVPSMCVLSRFWFGPFFGYLNIEWIPFNQQINSFNWWPTVMLLLDTIDHREIELFCVNFEISSTLRNRKRIWNDPICLNTKSSIR